MIEFSVRPWTSWPEPMQTKLQGLTFIIEFPLYAELAVSGMLWYCKLYPDLLETWVALLDGEPIGWALRVHTTFEGGKGWPLNMRPLEGETMLYVHSDHRRKGVGRALLALVEQDRGPGLAIPWDDASEDFYSSLAHGWEMLREPDYSSLEQSGR